MILPGAFVSKFEVQPNGCWHWVAALNHHGYGRFRFNDKIRLAHRLAYEWLVGPIPEGLQIDHLCRHRACVNPEHLEAVTPLENTRRGEGHGSETHCPHGHAYDELNTYPVKGGRVRMCLTCKRNRGREYMRMRRAAA